MTLIKQSEIFQGKVITSVRLRFSLADACFVFAKFGLRKLFLDFRKTTLDFVRLNLDFRKAKQRISKVKIRT